MSMTELVSILETNGKGVRAYVECGREARRCITEYPEQAIAYFLLAVTADRFVEAYDDQPLYSDKAEEAYLRFKKHVDQIIRAEKENSDSVMLKTLNEMSVEIANHSHY